MYTINPMSPVPEGNKYRNLALLVGEVSKIETIN
jgi:hypothetical protein